MLLLFREAGEAWGPESPCSCGQLSAGVWAQRVYKGASCIHTQRLQVSTCTQTHCDSPDDEHPHNILMSPPPLQCHSLFKPWLWRRRLNFHWAGCQNCHGNYSPVISTVLVQYYIVILDNMCELRLKMSSSIGFMSHARCFRTPPGWGAPAVWTRGRVRCRERKPPRSQSCHAGSEVCCGAVVHPGSGSRGKGICRRPSGE